MAILKVIVDTCDELLLNMSVELDSFCTTFFDCTSESSLLEVQSNQVDLRCDQGGAEIWEGSIFLSEVRYLTATCSGATHFESSVNLSVFCDLRLSSRFSDLAFVAGAKAVVDAASKFDCSFCFFGSF